MKHDRLCPHCRRPIRNAISQHNTPILLDAAAVVGGPWGVVEWIPPRTGALSLPVVAAFPDKAETPTRYREHQCLEL